MTLFFINFVSAQFGFGYGGRFSLADFFDSIDPSTIVYGLIFFILFTVIFLVLSKAKLFKSKKGPWGAEETNSVAAAVVSFAVSALAVYYMYRNGYNLQSFLYEIGFSGDIIALLLSLLVVLVAIVIVIKFKLPGFFIASGLLLILIAIFTDLIYEKGLAFLIGLALVVIGIFFWKATRKWWGQHMRTV